MMSIVEQLLDLIGILIDKTTSGKLNWVKSRDTLNAYECEINELLSIKIRKFDRADMMIQIGNMGFFAHDVPAIKDPLFTLISEIYTREHYKGVFEKKLLELADITLEIEKI